VEENRPLTLRRRITGIRRKSLGQRKGKKIRLAVGKRSKFSAGTVKQRRKRAEMPLIDVTQKKRSKSATFDDRVQTKGGWACLEAKEKKNKKHTTNLRFETDGEAPFPKNDQTVTGPLTKK